MRDFGDLTPPEHFAGSGGFSARRGVGNRWSNMLVADAGLMPDDAMLDVGCGLGRMAVPLMDYLSDEGFYEGFDIDAEVIQWCKENITARRPNFRFKLADLYNEQYNPGGTASPEEFVFPYEDATFDVALLASVFTHLLPKAVENYLKELCRVLKPGGRCVASYFLLNPHSLQEIAEGNVRPRYRFPHQLEGCRVKDEDVPEMSVAHHEDRVRNLYEESGLKILEPIRYGKWAGGPHPLGNQDIVFAVRP